jgi:sugar lactone lactonase YvrE
MTTSTSDVELALKIRSAVAEGPVWDERSQSLVWVDIMNHQVHVFDPSTGQDRAIDVGQPVGAAAPRQAGGLVLALHDGFALLDADLGTPRMVAPIEADVAATRMNDGKCDAAGRFWAGTMAYNQKDPIGSLYRLDPDLRVTQVVRDVTLSNGLDWSLDNRQMYYVDSTTQGLDAFDFDLAQGTLGQRRRLVSIPAQEGLPDGMTVDAEGGLWLALHGSGTVRRYLPSGELDRVIRVPARYVTCCAFGGPDYQDLYITTMTYGFSDEELKDTPLAGSLFRCRPGVRGRPAFRFAG